MEMVAGRTRRRVHMQQHKAEEVRSAHAAWAVNGLGSQCVPMRAALERRRAKVERNVAASRVKSVRQAAQPPCWMLLLMCT